MFHIVLVAPQIAPNTGNVIRLAANTGCTLHLIEPLGFALDDRRMRRAGLDYHEYTALRCHPNWAGFVRACQPAPAHTFALSTQAQRCAYGARFADGDWLVFGNETSGLPAAVHAWMQPQHCLRLPMRAGQRSLNLSNAVAVTVFEAWRQQGFM